MLPILYPTMRESYRDNKRNFLLSFVLGCVAATIYYFGYAIYRSSEFVNGIWVFNPIPTSGWNNYFLSTEFSHLIHPSYLALYLLVAILIIGFALRRWRRIRSILKIAVILGTIVLLSSLILLQSRAGILGFGLLALVWLFYLVFAKRRYILGVGVFLALMSLAIIVFTKFNRLANTAKSLENTADFGFNRQSKDDATAIRFWIWKSDFLLIKEHPVWGVGTGDVRDMLQKQYERQGMTNAAQERLNAHNQYLETWLGTGIFGLLALLAMLFVPLWVGVKKGDWLVVGFLSLCSVSFMFESMLNTIAGVGFFAIFYTLLVSNLAVRHEKALAK
ncbi:MAG TPA: O-antigen ligase family protein [Williamwhitmania sp.]|nr:O-antigen ligase family protein [Williamwhitmania sp.]